MLQGPVLRGPHHHAWRLARLEGFLPVALRPRTCRNRRERRDGAFLVPQFPVGGARIYNASFAYIGGRQERYPGTASCF